MQVASNWKEKVWWECHVADNHVFESPLTNFCLSLIRDSRFKGCRFSARRIVIKSNFFTTAHVKVGIRSIQLSI